MNYLSKLLFVFVFCCSLTQSEAQSVEDTILLSENYSENQDFSSAIKILEQYQRDHPEDLRSFQLIALNYYWSGQFEKADSVYVHAIRIHPDSSLIKIDHASMLLQLGELNKSKAILDAYIIEHPDDIAALEYLGYIHYWQGRHIAALNQFEHILKIEPDNITALAMTATLNKIVHPYLLLQNEFSYDSQPLRRGGSGIEFGIFISPLLKPMTKLNVLYFLEDDYRPVYWMELGNKMTFFKNKTHLITTIGYLKNTASETVVTGLVELKQDLVYKLSMTLRAERQPYFYTLSSLQQTVTFNAYTATLDWNDAKGINAQLFLNEQYFMDGNSIQNVSIWGLSPDFGWEDLKFNLGYSYSYANASEDHFESQKTLGEILDDYPVDNIEGIYSPYFTPANQNIHSILGGVSYRASEKLDIKMKGGISVSAYADIPFLFLNKDVDENIFIDKDFAKEQELLFNLSLIATYDINPHLMLDASYVYTENFFYINSMFSLDLKYIF